MIGTKIYENVADNINFQRFFINYRMPNTFNSWFLITELHTWMILVKLMEEPEKGRIVRNAIVDSLWQDTSIRAKQLGADNPAAVRKQLMDLSEQFQAALIIYDDGLQSNDKVLASSLWERLLEKKCNDYRNLEEVVCYVRQNVHEYDSIKYEDILKDPKVAGSRLILANTVNNK